MLSSRVAGLVAYLTLACAVALGLMARATAADAPSPHSDLSAKPARNHTATAHQDDSIAPADTVLTVPVIRLEETAGTRVARTLTGVLAAKRSSELGFKRVGRIELMTADEGDIVAAGQTLATIDTLTLNAEMAAIAAQRSAAQARLDELVAGPRQQTIRAAQAQLAELKAVCEQLRSTFDRRNSLARSAAISRQDIDDARHQLAAAEAKMAAQEQVLAELNEGTRAEQLAAQRAECARLDASHSSIQVLMDESRLVAPYPAMISRRLADEGTITAPGEPLFRIVEIAALEARVGVPPELIPYLIDAQQHELEVNGKLRQARLKAALPELDSTTRTRTVVFELMPSAALSTTTDSADATARDPFAGDAIGQIVQLQVTQPVKQSGFWLPLSALVRGVKGLWAVYVIETDDTDHQSVVQRKDVEVVQIETDRVMVTGTLQAGERIVTSGVQKLVAGQRVTPVEQPPVVSPASAAGTVAETTDKPTAETAAKPTAGSNVKTATKPITP